jgi:hypothetical protein
VFFIAPRAAKTAPLQLRSMKLKELINSPSRLTGIKALNYLGIGIPRALSFTTQDPKCFHIDADGLSCHTCIMHA